MKADINLDEVQENTSKRMAAKRKGRTSKSPYFNCPIAPATDKSINVLRDFRYEPLMYNNKKKRRVGGATSKTRKKENR